MTAHRYFGYRVLWAGRWRKGTTRLPLSLLEGREDVEILRDDFVDVESPENPEAMSTSAFQRNTSAESPDE